MSSFSSFRTFRRQFVLLGVALLLTQAPAVTLLAACGRPPAAALFAYALASVGAAGGLFAVALAFGGRIQRIVALVQGYAEHGRLPEPVALGSQTSDAQVHASLASLDRLVRSLEAEAARDPLTGIANRRTCAHRLEGDLARSNRSGLPFSVALFDLDELKAINDRHGHPAGDAALRRLATTLVDATREGDWVARWGGDEFLLGLWSADRSAAQAVAERVLARLAAEPVALEGRQLVLGSSAGVTQALPGDDPALLFSRVDAALLEAKRAGRGRVSVA